MSTSVLSLQCTPAGQPVGPSALGMKTPQPRHEDCPGGYSVPGVLGGWHCPCECHRRPSPGRLWQQAEREHPDDMDRLRARYRELMIEHGHLIPAEPGTDHNLPCGWPGKTK